MARRGDARGAVDIGADIALLRQERCAGVEPHPHGDRKRLLRLARGRKRAGRSREGDEEGVALGVDLDPAVTRESLAQHRPVLGEDICVRLLTQLV